jgi:hypothetical protein
MAGASEANGGGAAYSRTPAPCRAFRRHLAWTADGGEQIRILATIWDFENDGVASRTLDGPLRATTARPGGRRLVRAGTLGLRSTRRDRRSWASIPAWRGWRLTLDGGRR